VAGLIGAAWQIDRWKLTVAGLTAIKDLSMQIFSWGRFGRDLI
jgi:hypothetical protein